MNGEIKKRYLRLVRRAYRFLRSPTLHRHPWIRKIIRPIFDRELWHPCRDTVSSGLSIGLFVSMLPMPGQMLLAAVTAVKLRANVAIAIAACWVSNPLSQLPLWVIQEGFGDFLRKTLGIPIHPLLEKIQIPIPPIGGMEASNLNLGSFILGFLSMAFLLSLLAYPLVYILSAMLPKLLPKTRYQRAKAKVVKARLLEEKKGS